MLFQALSDESSHVYAFEISLSDVARLQSPPTSSRLLERAPVNAHGDHKASNN